VNLGDLRRLPAQNRASKVIYRLCDFNGSEYGFPSCEQAEASSASSLRYSTKKGDAHEEVDSSFA
jgi:hypothetical protein